MRQDQEEQQDLDSESPKRTGSVPLDRAEMAPLNRTGSEQTSLQLREAGGLVWRRTGQFDVTPAGCEKSHVTAGGGGGSSRANRTSELKSFVKTDSYRTLYSNPEPMDGEP